jgi:hypothetical protein
MSKSKATSNNEEDLNVIKKAANEVLVTGKTIFFRGASMDQASFLTLVTTALAPFDNVNEHRTLLHLAIAARDAQEDAASQFVRDVKAAVSATFGENSKEFTDFGFHAPKKPAPLSPEKRNLKNARAQATRKARGTLGPKARKAVKGVVTTPDNGSAQAPPSSPKP